MAGFPQRKPMHPVKVRSEHLSFFADYSQQKAAPQGAAFFLG